MRTTHIPKIDLGGDFFDFFPILTKSRACVEITLFDHIMVKVELVMYADVRLPSKDPGHF